MFCLGCAVDVDGAAGGAVLSGGCNEYGGGSGGIGRSGRGGAECASTAGAARGAGWPEPFLAARRGRFCLGWNKIMLKMEYKIDPPPSGNDSERLRLF